MKINYIANGEARTSEGSVRACLRGIDDAALFGTVKVCNTYVTRNELQELQNAGRLWGDLGNIHDTDELQSVAEQLGSYGSIAAGYKPLSHEPLLAPPLYEEAERLPSFAGAAGGPGTPTGNTAFVQNGDHPVLEIPEINWASNDEDDASLDTHQAGAPVLGVETIKW